MKGLDRYILAWIAGDRDSDLRALLLREAWRRGYGSTKLRAPAPKWMLSWDNWIFAPSVDELSQNEWMVFAFGNDDASLAPDQRRRLISAGINPRASRIFPCFIEPETSYPLKAVIYRMSPRIDRVCQDYYYGAGKYDYNTWTTQYERHVVESTRRTHLLQTAHKNYLQTLIRLQKSWSREIESVLIELLVADPNRKGALS